MVSSMYYVPILKWKQGEQNALKVMPTEEKTKIIPLIEVLPPSDSKKIIPPEENIKNAIKKIEKCWGPFPCLLDINTWIPDKDITAKNLSTAYLNKGPLNPIFVASLSLNNSTKEVFKVITSSEESIALRLTEEEIIEESFITNLDQFMQNLSITPNSIHLILDLHFTGARPPKILARDMQLIIQEIPYLNEWKSFTIAGTGFPNTLAGIPTNNVAKIPRNFWLSWNQLIKQEDLVRLPWFGDYCINGFEPPVDYKPFMGGSANIRYTSENNWTVIKGKSLKGSPGYAQYHDMSKILIAMPEYSGKQFSCGDAYIYDCANKEVGTGSQTTWRHVGTSHHVAFVLNQLANLP